MSAAMRQGVANLLVRKTNSAKNKADNFLFNVRKDLERFKPVNALGASAKHAEHKLYSDLIGLVERQVCNADKLLHKNGASYFDYLDAIRNLERLENVTSQISSLADLYARRQQLKKQVNQAEERQSKCEAQRRSLADIPLPRTTSADLMPLAWLIGYCIVGYTLGSLVDPEDTSYKYFLLFAWPIAVALVGLVALLSASIYWQIGRRFKQFICGTCSNVRTYSPSDSIGDRFRQGAYQQSEKNRL